MFDEAIPVSMGPSMKICHRCGGDEFGYWTSTSTGKKHRYCRACRRDRANTYTKRKMRNGGHHTQKEWLEKLATFDRCPGCALKWNEIPPRPDRRYKYVWTQDHIKPVT